MKENKIFNLRIMFLVFVCFIVGILTTVYYLTSVWFGLIILFLCLALIIFCYVRNKINFIIAIVCGVTIFLGCCAVVVERAKFEHSASFENDIICGEIIYYSTDYSDYTNLIINNVEINNNKFNGNISIRYIGENLALNNPIGYKISFVADEYSKISYIENKEINNYFIRNDIKYEVLTSEIAIGKRKADLKIYIQDKIKENLILGIGNSNAELMYSAIFGDKSNLEDNTKEIFTASGVAHILAVSGLHVGLVVACLTFILKICRANKLTKFLIISLFLLFYCNICGWSFSVVRATIMAIVLLGCSLCYREYDSLNSISLAGLIILAISPSALFDVSFLLSFMCVLGISMFNKSFNKFLVKIHCNNRVCNALAISIITNVSIFMVSACYFKEINIIGIFANVFILPLFSLAFVLCFIIGALFFIPFIFYLLRPLQYLIEFIRLLVYFFSRFDVFLFQTLNIPNFAVYLYAVMLFFVSRYCFASKEKKLAISSIFVAIIIGLSLSGRLV